MPVLKNDLTGLPKPPDKIEDTTSIPVKEDESLTVVQAIKEFKRESEDARKNRMALNKRNMNAFLNTQDYSDKISGQSKEFLPKTEMAVEQTVAFIQKALSMGDWFTLEYTGKYQNIIKSTSLTKFLKSYIHKTLNLPKLIGDATKIGLLKSLLIAKVYALDEEEKEFIPITNPETGEQTVDTISTTKTNVKVDLVRPEDYYPDPTGVNLYEIHSTSRDLHEAIELAESGYYDLESIKQIEEDFRKEKEEYRQAIEEGQNVSTKPSFRKSIHIDEFWGTLLDEDGKVVERNIVAAVANEKYLIRVPKPNSRWDGESPFIVSALVTLPFSVWHKAFFDHIVGLNLALNDLFNLMLDGGIASVWGTKLIAVDALKNPSQIADGIGQADTLSVKSGHPIDQILYQATTGKVPSEALAMYGLLDKELLAGSLRNEISMGMLPSKKVKATEVVASGRNTAMFFDNMVNTLEKGFILTTIKKIWTTLLQISDTLTLKDLLPFMSKDAAVAFLSLSPQERFAEFANNSKFRVFGISSVVKKAQEFQKLIALLQVIATNPLFAPVFMKKYSLEKVLDQLIKSLDIDPHTIELSEQEKMMAQLQQILNGEQGGTPPAETNNQKHAGKLAAKNTGEPGLPAEIARMVQGNMGFK